MNTIVRSTSLASAAAISAPAIASPYADTALSHAVTAVLNLTEALDRLYREYGDEADTRADYQQIEDERDAALARLADTRGVTWDDLLAKAAIVDRINPHCPDLMQIDVAASLARDILRMAGASS